MRWKIYIAYRKECKMIYKKYIEILYEPEENTDKT